MNASPLRNFLIIFVCAALSVRISAAETGPMAPSPAENSTVQTQLNGYLQIQEQLHDTQLAIERNHQQAEAAAKRNADGMAVRLETLQQVIVAQHASAVETMQRMQQFMLVLAGVLGTVGLVVVLLLAYLQWRTVSRLVELSSLHPPGLAPGNGRISPPLVTSASVEQSNARLFNAVDQMEKRILELKQVTRAPLNETTSSAVQEPNGAPKIPSDRDECVANLLAEGQSLLVANEPQKALECFDVALGLKPKHADALVKKGGALEKLCLLDEAIACYDHAIEADSGMTIAYLHKGGLFNRMARYDEALHCYEQALRTQEKKTPDEKTAA